MDNEKKNPKNAPLPETDPGEGGCVSAKPKRTAEQNAALIAKILVVAAAVIAYALYASKHTKRFELQDWLVSASTLALFTAAVLLAVPKLVHTLFGHSDTLLVRPRNSKRVFLWVCLGALLAHILTMVIGVLVYNKLGHSMDKGFFTLMRSAWMKGNTDAQHYINIAENWYQSEGNDKLLLVFFPMLPIMIRLVNLLTNDSFVSALIINTIATALASGMTYLTLTPIIGDSKAKPAAFVALLLPGMIFMNSPMSEPLFVLFSVCCFYALQKRMLIPAGIFAALAGFTRSLGVLLAVPIAIEAVSYIVSLARNKKKWRLQLVFALIALAVSTFGTLGYLYINKAVSGEWLKFLEYQKSNWYQETCPFFETIRYIVRYLEDSIVKGNTSMLVHWITSLVMIFGTLLMIGSRARKLPSTYTFYFFAYFIVCIGCTWLLSSVRYLSALLPLTAAISLGFDKKWKNLLSFGFAFLVLGASYVGYMLLYMMRWSVY